MTAAREIAKVVPAAVAAARPAVPGRAEAPVPARRLAARIGNVWLPRVSWTVGRTGRLGLSGIALLLAAAVFWLSTHRPLAIEVETLRADLEAAGRGPAPAVPDQTADPAPLLGNLPARTDMPAILRQLFTQATQAKLAIDTGRYEIRETKRGGVVRHQITFPVTGPYPQVRRFIDTTLSTMPAVALSDLLIERKSIGDGVVEAQIRLTVYTAGADGRGGAASAAPGAKRPPAGESRVTEEAPPAAARTPATGPGSGRVVPPTYASALFAQHSWVVLAPMPKLPPPPPPAPPPPPTAPPLPYALVGSYSPSGEAPVFFLARGDHVISAHVGDRLDDAYQLESADGGQLVFLYLPLNIRQNIPAGASK